MTNIKNTKTLTMFFILWTWVVVIACQPILQPDVKAPVITVAGYFDGQTIDVAVGNGFVIPGAIATDSMDGQVPVMTNDGGYDNDVTNTYIVVYTAMDSANNSDTFTLTLVVGLDTESPVITVAGYFDGQTIDVVIGDGFIIPGATARDNVDGLVPVMTNTGGYDNDVINTYTVVYTAMDSANNTNFFTLTIVVDVDMEAPVITVAGYSDGQVIGAVIGDGFTIPGATARDNVDGMVPVMTNIGGYDNDVPNTYTVLYTAVDSANNTNIFTLTIVLEVFVDREAPVITVAGGYTNGQTIDVVLGDGFTIPGATAIDNVDGMVPVMTNIMGEFGVAVYNNDRPANYTVIYTAVDSTNNTNTFTLNINNLFFEDFTANTTNGWNYFDNGLSGVSGSFVVNNGLAEVSTGNDNSHSVGIKRFAGFIQVFDPVKLRVVVESVSGDIAGDGHFIGFQINTGGFGGGPTVPELGVRFRGGSAGERMDVLIGGADFITNISSGLTTSQYQSGFVVNLTYAQMFGTLTVDIEGGTSTNLRARPGLAFSDVSGNGYEMKFEHEGNNVTVKYDSISFDILSP